MAQTFEQVWRAVRAEAPLVPPLLARLWAQQAYSELCDRWSWSWLRAENILSVTAARTLTVGVTIASTTITSAAAFVSTDAGRQIRVTSASAQGRLPIYTIKSVTNASAAELDLAYVDPTDNAATATIFDGYATMPADFRRFLVVYDRYYLRTIPFWLSEDEIAVADPGHVFSDVGPRYLVARKYSSATATLGRVQYEYWPAPTSARVYPYLYIRGAETLNDADSLPGVLSQRLDLLTLAVQRKLALWPGTPDQKNPSFSPALAKLLGDDLEKKTEQLILKDDDEYPQQLMLVHWMRRYGSIAPTGTLLRQTDATVNDYF